MGVEAHSSSEEEPLEALDLECELERVSSAAVLASDQRTAVASGDHCCCCCCLLPLGLVVGLLLPDLLVRRVW